MAAAVAAVHWSSMSLVELKGSQRKELESEPLTGALGEQI